jgi:polar amino acid transport system substrate-binding protein
MHARLGLICGVVGAAAAIAIAAAPASVTPPPSIAKTGRLVYCSDMTYPPEESIQRGKPVGSDIDIATAVARQMGVRANFKQVGFDRLIAAVREKRCDAVISGMTDNAERRQQVDFADYMALGYSLVVAKGNPHHVTGLASLSGLKVAVQAGTSEKDALDAENKLLAKRGRDAVVIEVFARDSDAAAALLARHADVYFSDDLGVRPYLHRWAAKVALAASRIESAPIGIATRRGDPLGVAVRRAIAQLYGNGKMKAILAKWGLATFAVRV